MSIHGTGNFLSWHRYFTYAYENALRVECAYNGTQPYWDWGRYSTPETSPIFDGSETSMGSQGEKVTHNSNGMKPAGQGGGCIAKGPFKDMKVNLGYVLEPQLRCASLIGIVLWLLWAIPAHLGIRARTATVTTLVASSATSAVT
jgi:hypothetical protein